MPFTGQYWGEQWEGVSVLWHEMSAELNRLEIHMECKEVSLAHNGDEAPT